MAGTSPRRSIRSRPSLPQNFTPQHSSTSSSTSGRGERTTRTSAKIESPRKRASHGSSSSEPLDDTVVSSVEDSISTRRRKRGQPEEQEKDTEEKDTEMSNGISEPVGENDEAVRCICGSDDYPGPPQITEEDSKRGLKDGAEPDLLSPEDYTDDLAGFFLQCDICKVWQHGGCVGIKNEDMSPDEYFCELCRKDLHKIYTASNGQKYSHYLPLYQHLSRDTSRAASYTKDGTRSPRSASKTARPTSSSAMLDKNNPKRRSTMNSRDAAYNEEEQLRRAIEASKGEKGEAGEGSTRRGKRGRSDSEDKLQPIKRQRTMSRSVSPVKGLHNDAAEDSDTEMNGQDTVSKKIRGAAARNHERKLREDREKARLEAANKRKGRAERRRVEDSENGAETPIQPPRTKIEKVVTVEDSTADPEHESPNGSPKEKLKVKAATPQEKVKKGGRPPHPRKGKGGKNQYTRDTDDGSPARSASRDVASRDETSDAPPRVGHARLAKADTHDGHGPGRGRPASKGGRGVSMLDMRKRVAGMLAFIQQTQLEMAEAGEMKTPPDERQDGLEPQAQPPESEKDKELKGVMTGIMSGLKAANPDAGGGEEEAKEFKDLSLLKMMDVLTTELVKWQEQFA